MQSDYYGMPVGAKKKFWEEQFKNWRQSGLSQIEFCKRYGIKPYLWFYWKRAVNKAERSVTFVPLPLPALSGHASAAIRVITPNGFTIEIENPASIQQLIRDVAAI
jgi:hypothetical protein